MKFKKRIIGMIDIRGDRILPHPKNFRLHPDRQREVLRGLLAEIGVGDALVAVPASEERIKDALAITDKAARRAWAAEFERGTEDVLLLDGHLRAEEIRDQTLEVILLDLLPHEQAKFLAMFDPVGDLAGFDRDKFVDLAADFNSTNAAVQALVADLAAIKVGDSAGPFDGSGNGDGSGASKGDPDGREFDETIAGDVDAIVCPGCSLKFPRPS